MHESRSLLLSVHNHSKEHWLPFLESELQVSIHPLRSNKDSPAPLWRSKGEMVAVNPLSVVFNLHWMYLFWKKEKDVLLNCHVKVLYSDGCRETFLYSFPHVCCIYRKWRDFIKLYFITNYKGLVILIANQNKCGECYFRMETFPTSHSPCYVHAISRAFRSNTN